jgi:hypothetical protein
MDLAARYRFQSIEDDGFDPGRVMATPKQSMLNYVAVRQGYRQTRKDYEHPLWRALQDRQWTHAKETEFTTETLRKAGVAALEHADATRADELGLEWPDIFRRQALTIDGSEGELAKVIPGAYWVEPITHPLGALVDPSQLATLDGLLALLLLYRHYLDTGALERANDCRNVLGCAADLFIASCIGERLDTWRHVIRTRMLAWVPEFQPSADAIRRAEAKIHERFNGDANQGGVRKRGRAKLDPADAKAGKVARRWRRRTLMLASAESRDALGPIAGFQALNQFNDWLVSQRRLIDAHLSKTAYFAVLEEGTDPEIEATLLRDLAPLVIPENESHRVVQPYVDEQRCVDRAIDPVPE